MSSFRRVPIGHAVPAWVDDAALFFVTICAANRDDADFTVDRTASVLMESVRFYHAQMKWHARLFLLMPDHVHALLSFPSEDEMAETIRNWKRYTSRVAGIRWQKNFFDHRIRNDDNWELKAEYIRANPVRKGLVSRADEWSHVFVGTGGS